MGELEPWMDENFVKSIWFGMGEQVSVKMIRDKFSGYAPHPRSPPKGDGQPADSVQQRRILLHRLYQSRRRRQGPHPERLHDAQLATSLQAQLGLGRGSGRPPVRAILHPRSPPPC